MGGGGQVILGFHVNSLLCAETGTPEGLRSLCLSFLAQIPFSLSVQARTMFRRGSNHKKVAPLLSFVELGLKAAGSCHSLWRVCNCLCEESLYPLLVLPCCLLPWLPKSRRTT